MRGSVDIGSNSILLLVEDNDGNIVANESRVTGLGRGLDETLRFSDEAMADSLQAFRDYAVKCEEVGINTSEVIVTATEASRVAKNSKEFFKKVDQDFGFKVQIITGEAEAYYSTMGVLNDNNIADDHITIMDIGGASTELIKVEVRSKKILQSFSMPVGVIRLNNWAAEGTREQNLNRVLEDYAKGLDAVASSTIHCVAGTMTSVGNMFLNHKDFKEQEVHGLEISFDRIKEMKTKYANFDSEDFLREFPFLGKRSKSIFSGFILAQSVLETLKSEKVYISTYGLRYGTLNSGGIDDGFIFKG